MEIIGQSGIIFLDDEFRGLFHRLCPDATLKSYFVDYVLQFILLNILFILLKMKYSKTFKARLHNLKICNCKQSSTLTMNVLTFRV